MRPFNNPPRPQIPTPLQLQHLIHKRPGHQIRARIAIDRLERRAILLILADQIVQLRSRIEHDAATMRLHVLVCAERGDRCAGDLDGDCCQNFIYDPERNWIGGWVGIGMRTVVSEL